tara:strand:- start:72 stop:563 length:492 start_codon:yes stop_codon:yes gene_type:complete
MNKGAKNYLGSIVLGLNDALVELTGVLAGLTLALQNSRIIVVSGLIIGLAASLSMAASEYLSTKAEANGRSPGVSAFYTGIAYLITVLFLIFPYLVLSNVYYSLIWALINAIIVIAVFTHFASIEKGQSFGHRFFEMLVISMGVAAISFGFGFLIRMYFGVEI